MLLVAQIRCSGWKVVTNASPIGTIRRAFCTSKNVINPSHSFGLNNKCSTPQVIGSPFNDDRPFSVAQLRTISFAKLAVKDQHEQAKLLSAAQEDGFFYLDLMASDSQGLWEDYQRALKAMSVWFEQPVEAKLPFAYGSDVQGYKPIGTQTGVTEKSKDGFETLRIAQGGLESAKNPLPRDVLQCKELFDNFITNTRFHVLTLLSCLSDASGLQGSDRYELAHNDDGPSNSSMTFHRYPKQNLSNAENIGHNKHTDISSIAFLFAQQWGLQVPSKGVPAHLDGWDWVRPRPGYAICNIGDSLRFLSGKRFRSVLHRVLPVAEMERTHRYSVAYFCRPVDGTMFRDPEGRMIACDEWFSHKFDVYRATHEEQRKSTILTGGME